MKLAVTGGNGRIGQAVIALALASGHEVINIDRSPETKTEDNITYRQVDVTDFDALAAAITGAEALIHLAAITSPDLDPAHVVHNNNVIGSYNALQAAADLGIRRVCLASSVNAIGGAFSRAPRYDYFPVDEQHPTYNEDPYSLSKWIVEQQADSFARRYEHMTIASLRFHGVFPEQLIKEAPRWEEIPERYQAIVIKHLFGYVRKAPAAYACLLAVTADFTGHEVFYIVAPRTMMEDPSVQLAARHYPGVPIVGDLDGHRSFFNCQKAARLLGWRHDEHLAATGD